jgi:hemerythrin-like metal-binding protein
MSRLLWSDDYSVHIRSIDNEHKLLVGLLNDIDGALQMEVGQQLRRQLALQYLLQLQLHALAHFESEERFLLLNNYAGVTAHQEEHRDLVRTLEEFAQAVISGKQEVDDSKLFFLKDWLVRHIILLDCTFGEHFKGRTDLVAYGS